MKAGRKQHEGMEKELTRQRDQQDSEVWDGDMLGVFTNKKVNKMT